MYMVLGSECEQLPEGGSRESEGSIGALCRLRSLEVRSCTNMTDGGGVRTVAEHCAGMSNLNAGGC